MGLELRSGPVNRPLMDFAGNAVFYRPREFRDMFGVLNTIYWAEREGAEREWSSSSDMTSAQDR